MNTPETAMLSVILLSYHSEARLVSTCEKIRERMQAEAIPYEIVIIDDGSTDTSFEVAGGIAKDHSDTSAWQLSKNFTSPYAQFAGFKVCKGACAVPVPDDLQRPLDLVVKMYRAWQAGAKIVIGYRTQRDDGWLSDRFSNWYYRIMNTFSGIQFPPGGADGFLADREIIDILNTAIHPIRTSPIIEVLKMGFDPVFIPYERPPHKGKSRWTLSKKLNLAANNFFATSVFPLRLISLVGFLVFGFSLILILAIIGAKLFSDNTLFGFPVQGWATLMVLLTLFNGLVLFSLGIVAEYIWRIHEEVKGRPGYYIKGFKEEE